MDYKVLLEKYIQHVVKEEGISFISMPRFLYTDFTEEEKEELMKIKKDRWDE